MMNKNTPATQQKQQQQQHPLNPFCVDCFERHHAVPSLVVFKKV